MSIPDRPDPDDLIATDWGRWVHDGMVLLTGPWTPYTPTNTNITVGNGTQTAAYLKIGRTVFFSYRLVLGSTSAIGSSAAIGLPVAAARQQTVPAMLAAGAARIFPGAGRIDGSSCLLVHPESAANGLVTPTAPATWTTGDEILVTGSFEAAS